MPNIERPYRSPLGVLGAVVAGGDRARLAGARSWNYDYRPGVYGVAIFYVVARRLLRDRGPSSPGALAGGGVRDDAWRSTAIPSERVTARHAREEAPRAAGVRLRRKHGVGMIDRESRARAGSLRLKEPMLSSTS